MQFSKENTSSVNFMTTSKNETVPDKTYLKLLRAPVTEKSDNFHSTCSSHVRLLRGYQRKTKGIFSFDIHVYYSKFDKDHLFFLKYICNGNP